MSANKPAPWIERYEELKKYKETRGDCNVPQRHGSLGIWVRSQRKCYRSLKEEAKSSRMSDDRIQKLEAIGFQWSVGYSKFRKGETVQYDARFQELKKYKETHGHCNVPRKHGSLGIWVQSQRTNYLSLKNEGKSSRMTDDRIQKLESIGFQWSIGYSKFRKGETVQWDARFQELKKYKETHGDCNVPMKHGPLGNWVDSQRTNYRLLKARKSAHMSDDRIQKLEAIGFQWSCNQQRDIDAIMQLPTNNTSPDAKSGHKCLLISTSSAAADAQTCVTGNLEENQTNEQAVASPVISYEEHIADSSKSTCDEAPEFRPFLLGTGYC